MVGNLGGSGTAEARVVPAQSGTPAVTQCTEGCPCLAFQRYNDPFGADYEITNCAGLSARLRNIWGNLEIGQVFTYQTDSGKTVSVEFTVRGLQQLARADGALIDRGDDYSSDAPDSACDILFVLWPLSASAWGGQYVDKNGTVVYRQDPIENSDFHIVAGRIDRDGKMPNEVYSTNGGRPLEGPAPIARWAFTGNIPYTTSPENSPVFLRTDAFTGLPDTLVPFQAADIPSNAIDESTGQQVEAGVEYFQVMLYNDRPTTEAFIVKADFMRAFSSSP
ncbi:hypothetical protein BDE40_1895 [Litoreibacter halocynthiae]|uniref:Uncharacterized protein n=1 Tax=Litoreibacter halocynthiae TaxID=1242689 RepID=A0A4R7LHE9_9RHOB|nr:hypothetical protein [Litoreibacter halocynthiae]TDT75168.1 hypothetical protein BDE40_1895 [Litoreibacter halocynthiae]